LSNRMIDTAAAAGRGTAPFCNSTAASIEVHVAACVAVAHRRMRDAIVTDLVVHPDKTILRQTVLFVSAVHKKLIKAKLPRQMRNENTARRIESFLRRERRRERTSRGILLLSLHSLDETFALYSGRLFSFRLSSILGHAVLDRREAEVVKNRTPEPRIPATLLP
jgi:hypothetical protein